MANHSCSGTGLGKCTTSVQIRVLAVLPTFTYSSGNNSLCFQIREIHFAFCPIKTRVIPAFWKVVRISRTGRLSPSDTVVNFRLEIIFPFRRHEPGGRVCLTPRSSHSPDGVPGVGSQGGWVASRVGCGYRVVYRVVRCRVGTGLGTPGRASLGYPWLGLTGYTWLGPAWLLGPVQGLAWLLARYRAWLGY